MKTTDLLARQGDELVPVPDPTLMTTSAILLAIKNLKELMEAKIGFTNTLKEEKFKELHERLAMVEAHRREAKSDLAEGLERSLSNQKELLEQARKCNEEAADRQSAVFTKQLESLSKETQLGRSAIGEQILALKERMDRGTGAKEQTTEVHQKNAWLVPMIVIGSITMLGLILQIIQMIPVHGAR